MELYHSPTSPFSRKTRIVVREKGMQGWVSEIEVTPFDDPEGLLAASPVGKVPTLVDRDRVLVDSRVICAYLDSLARPALEPSGSLAWDDRVRAAIADALAESALAIRLERLRPDGERSPGWIHRQHRRIERVVAAVPPGAHAPTLGDIAVASALAYLDFRLPRIDWRSQAPELARWHEVVEARPAFAAVAFPRG